MQQPSGVISGPVPCLRILDVQQGDPGIEPPALKLAAPPSER